MTDIDWLGKPYYSLDAYFKHTYGEKCYKLASISLLLYSMKPDTTVFKLKDSNLWVMSNTIL